MMLNLRANYLPRGYDDRTGKVVAVVSKIVTIIAVISTDQELNPEFLAVDDNGKFFTDTIDRFTYQDKG